MCWEQEGLASCPCESFGIRIVPKKCIKTVMTLSYNEIWLVPISEYTILWMCFTRIAAGFGKTWFMDGVIQAMFRCIHEHTRLVPESISGRQVVDNKLVEQWQELKGKRSADKPQNFKQNELSGFPVLGMTLPSKMRILEPSARLHRLYLNRNWRSRLYFYPVHPSRGVVEYQLRS